MGHGDRVAILGQTRLEWVQADTGTMNAGGVTVGIYPSNLGPECAYIMNDSGAEILFVENDAQLEKIEAVRSDMPKLRWIVRFEGPGDAERIGIANGETIRLVTRVASAELPAEVDRKLRDGHVWIPNGFEVSYPGPDGKVVMQGINTNELSDAADRDPISGCPHHKATPCRVERL